MCLAKGLFLQGFSWVKWHAELSLAYNTDESKTKCVSPVDDRPAPCFPFATLKTYKKTKKFLHIKGLNTIFIRPTGFALGFSTNTVTDVICELSEWWSSLIFSYNQKLGWPWCTLWHRLCHLWGGYQYLWWGEGLLPMGSPPLCWLPGLLKI